MNDIPFYRPAITADSAKFLKFGVDVNQQLRPLEKLLKKQAISNCIADPIDRECELRCDSIDFEKDIAQCCTHQLLGYCFCGNLANDLIFLNAERCKQNVHAQAAAARYYRDYCYCSW